MAMISSLTKWAADNPDLASLVGLTLAVSIAKLPDPRKYKDRKWSWAYDIAFQILSRLSLTAWDHVCGPMKMPGTVYPPLTPPEDHVSLPASSPGPCRVCL